MSLQMLRGESYSSKCDIWALGVIFYELIHDFLPFIADNKSKLATKISVFPLEIN